MSSSIDSTFSINPNSAEHHSERTSSHLDSGNDSDKTVIRQGQLIDVKASDQLTESGVLGADHVFGPVASSAIAITGGAGIGHVGQGRINPIGISDYLIGQQLDHFLIDELVGTGGMGAVFRGHDLRLDRVVAIKVVPIIDRDAETMRRFRFEAQSAAKLDHPNIARVYYVGETDRWSYIVFEFVEGINLRELVMKQGVLAVDDATCLIRQIAEALQHAWDRKVVHRDIKPSNILVTQEGQAKLVDMGLARTTELDKSTNDLTASGVTLGTFDYISPEQAHDPRAADVRSDIYSLGCTFYYLLTGQPPFAEGTALQKLLLHGTRLPDDPRFVRADLSESLIAILRKMMAKRPADRYCEPVDLIYDLRQLAEIEGLAWSRSTTGSVGLPLRNQRTWLEAFLPVVVSLAAIVFGTLWMAFGNYQSAAFPIPKEQIPDEVVPPPVISATEEAKAPAGTVNSGGNQSDPSPAITLGSASGSSSGIGTSSSQSDSSFNTVVVENGGVQERESGMTMEQAIDSINRTGSSRALSQIVVRPNTIRTSLARLRSSLALMSGVSIQPEENQSGNRLRWLIDGAESPMESIDSEAIMSCAGNQISIQDIDFVWQITPSTRRRVLFSLAPGSWLQLKNCTFTIQDESSPNNPASNRLISGDLRSVGSEASLPSVFMTEQELSDSDSQSLDRSNKSTTRFQLLNSYARGQCNLLKLYSSTRTEVSMENSWFALSGSVIETIGSRTAGRPGVPLRIDVRNITSYTLRSWLRTNLSNSAPYPRPFVRNAMECIFAGPKSHIEWNALDCVDWQGWQQTDGGQKLFRWVDLRGTDNTYDSMTTTSLFSARMKGSAETIALDTDSSLVADERGIETTAAWVRRPQLEATRLHETKWEQLEWRPSSFQPGYHKR
jgi:eukaryotic-like serine/threonine-protein kinase